MSLRTVFFVVLIAATCCSQDAPAGEPDRPNILWLSVEDVGPHLGCYGYDVATPNIDAFASRSLTFDTAWSNYPVCAPARTTIITGMYATALGAGNMRCAAVKPSGLQMLPELMRKAGYYCTNKTKTDYNLVGVADVWDDRSRDAHWKNRPADKPFFSVFNLTATHESKIRKRPHVPQIDPASVTLFPYWPDTPEVRQDWAQYLDNIQSMDGWFGKQLKQLEEAGLANDTIVIFWGDHGSGMPRHKRFAGDSGHRIPMIVHVPEKWKNVWSSNYASGARSDWPVGFVDLAPTVLEVAGVPIPEKMQGKSFLGSSTEKAKYVFGIRNRMDERYDVSRSVCDGRYVYIRNLMPHLPHGQFVDYQQETPSTAKWFEKFGKGELNDVQAAFWKPRAREELFDLEADPHETVNLANDPQHSEKLVELRNAVRAKMIEIGDLDLVPESTLYEYEQPSGDSRFTYSQRDGFDIARIFDAATGNDIEQNLEAQQPELRFWAVVNLLGQNDSNREVAGRKKIEKTIESLLQNDPSMAVRIKAAEYCLKHQIVQDKAIECLITLADKRNSNYYVACNAVDCLDRYRDITGDEVAAKIKLLPAKFDEISRGNNNMDKLLRRFTK